MTLLNGWTVESKSLGGELILVLRLVAALVAPATWSTSWARREQPYRYRYRYLYPYPYP